MNTDEQLLNHCKAIAETLANPPMVDEDGNKLPADAVSIDAQNGVEWVTGRDRRVPENEVLSTAPGVPEIPSYIYDEENDTWTCRVTGAEWHGVDCDGGWGWATDGGIVLGGKMITDASPMSGYDYLADVLDIEYRIGSDGEYRSAEVMVAFGGPNIWIDTKTNTVRGAWWSDRAEWSFTDEIGLDEALQELFACR